MEYVDLVLWTMYAVTAVAVVAAVWSACHRIAMMKSAPDSRADKVSTRIGYAVACTVAMLMAITALTASTEPVMADGKPFTDTLWLRLTDMFIVTSLLLIAICSVLIAIAKLRR